MVIGTTPTDDVRRRCKPQACTPPHRGGKITLNCNEDAPSPGKFSKFSFSLGMAKSWAEFKYSMEMSLGGPIYWEEFTVPLTPGADFDDSWDHPSHLLHFARASSTKASTALRYLGTYGSIFPPSQDCIPDVHENTKSFVGDRPRTRPQSRYRAGSLRRLLGDGRSVPLLPQRLKPLTLGSAAPTTWIPTRYAHDHTKSYELRQSLGQDTTSTLLTSRAPVASRAQRFRCRASKAVPTSWLPYPHSRSPMSWVTFPTLTADLSVAQVFDIDTTVRRAWNIRMTFLLYGLTLPGKSKVAGSSRARSRASLFQLVQISLPISPIAPLTLPP